MSCSSWHRWFSALPHKERCAWQVREHIDLALRMLIANGCGSFNPPWRVVAVSKEGSGLRPRVFMLIDNHVVSIDTMSLRAARMGGNWFDKAQPELDMCEGGLEMIEEWRTRRRLASL